MFKLNDRVTEMETNARDVVVDLDDSIDKPYGVMFEDVDDDFGVWWCDSNMIKEDVASDYNVEDFLDKIYERERSY